MRDAKANLKVITRMRGEELSHRNKMKTVFIEDTANYL